MKFSFLLTIAAAVSTSVSGYRVYQLAGADVTLSDIASQSSPSPVACLGYCVSQSACSAASWTNYNGGTCWLKSYNFLVAPTQPNPEVDSFFLINEAKPSVIWSDAKSGFDMAGNDIANTRRSSFDQCKGDCQANSRCFAVTWTNYEGGTCWLKSRANSFVASAGAISAWNARELGGSSRKTFLLIGDSITQYGGDQGGWGTLLQAAYADSVTVVNRGVGGYSTRTFLEKSMPGISSELQSSLTPALITVWLGTNDAAIADGTSGEKHVSLDQYRSNLVTIVSEFRRLAPQAKILVISPPVVDDDTRRSRQVAAGGKSDPIDYSNAQAGEYAKACGATVQTLVDGSDRVTFLDTYSYMMTTYPTAAARRALLSDGLHLSAEGNRVVFELIRGRVNALLGSA